MVDSPRLTNRKRVLQATHWCTTHAVSSLYSTNPSLLPKKAIEEGQDIKSTTQIVELSSQRMMVKDTDKGRELMVQIEDLKKLLVAYQNGIIKERGI